MLQFLSIKVNKFPADRRQSTFFFSVYIFR